MRTPQGIADLITAHRQHASLSFLNYASEVCVANVGFGVVRHLTRRRRRRPLILKIFSVQGAGMVPAVQRRAKMPCGKNILRDIRWELDLAQRPALCCKVKCLGWIRVTLINFSIIFQQIWQVLGWDTLKLLSDLKKRLWVKFQIIPKVTWISNSS